MVASLTASPLLPSACPTPTPDYSGADSRPQINSSVNISLVFLSETEKRPHYFTWKVTQIPDCHQLSHQCLHVVGHLTEKPPPFTIVGLHVRSASCAWLMPPWSLSVSRCSSPLCFSLVIKEKGLDFHFFLIQPIFTGGEIVFRNGIVFHRKWKLKHFTVHGDVVNKISLQTGLTW